MLKRSGLNVRSLWGSSIVSSRMRIGTVEGSCFVIDVDRRQYIITARHVASGIEKQVDIKLFINQQWLPLRARPIWPASERTDIVALAPDHTIAPKMDISIGEDNIFIGQDVYFLGFPFGLATEFEKPSTTHFQFIKKAILSAVDTRAGSGGVLYLDGVNNPGFSGGPVIFGNYDHGNRLQIGGVISGYRNNPLEVRSREVLAPNVKSGGGPKKRVVSYVLENTGIIVAYGMSEIVEAIRVKPNWP